ncbi:hypothetical protein Cs7R123_38840 [Catellatospora sp. TT07R-123]|uniref:hypothetical protein n=1 Tax=Catellatospora sp. TT07R-123 TaxID=2733863 RepID=UPI001B1130EC|nr:hypothetical protein [Catellatospora sp. TT07R-123]GHJ46542.1 hypothetical protein Cs7R123_38840 [Catellatospora sp. TT07R-123]
MKRLSLAVALGLLLGLTACGPAALPATATDLVASVEAESLAALGVDPADLVAAEPEFADKASPGPDKAGDGTDRRLRNWKHRKALRVLLRRGTLHGEAVVQTKQGTVTVLVQRGEVTAVDGSTVTVKSADGFTVTWTFGEKLRVVEKRATVQPSEVKVGAQVAVAGAKNGDTSTARLIVIPVAK